MERPSPLIDDAPWIEASGLRARAITYKYRYCSTCRREWPGKQSSCPTCGRWLGHQPLERIEWQIAPFRSESSTEVTYRLIGASAVMLRIISDNLPSTVLGKTAAVLNDVLEARDDRSICAIPEEGWLVWTMGSLRRAFLQGLEIEQLLTAALSQLEQTLHGTGRVRWGIWLDQYVVPFGGNDAPAISNLTAKAIFDFEPDNLLLCSEALYEANRHWEYFVCVPRRLLSDGEHYGYRLLGHKRPSALDHAKAAYASPFVGRAKELGFLTTCYRQSRIAHTRTALIADAGSGKTRLVREWRRQHLDLRMLVANFSLFGGDVVSFGGQLAALPSDRITTDALIGAVLARVEAEHIDALALDDLHWADPESVAFIEKLLDALSTKAILALLVARPSGRAVIGTLKPAATLELKPLPSSAAQELGRRLIGSRRIASIAARRSKGNPLFVEQFVAWAAETDYKGTGDAPRKLHQVIAARITHLSEVRLSEIRQRQRWGSSWERQAIERELNRLEDEIGLWLDRLETGDYGDRIEASRHLIGLERVDFEIFLTSTLAGKPRPRSSRLREAIERLLIGSADQILADLKTRAVNAHGAERANVLHEARRAGDVVAGRFNWRLAAEFYELALTLAEPRQRDEVGQCLADCRQRLPGAPVEAPKADEIFRVEENPAVDPLRLPKVWARLACYHDAAEYFFRAAEAAEAINDQALAEWAKRRATQLEER